MHICDSFLLTLCVILFIFFFQKKTANVINRSQSPTSSDDEQESPAVEEADYQPPTLPSFYNPTVPTSVHSPSHTTQNQPRQSTSVPDNQLQCQTINFSAGQSTSVPQQPFFSPVMQNFSDLLFSTEEDTSTNQPIDFLDASLTDFLPTPHRPRSNNVIEKKLDQMNKTLNTSERNQVDINNILAHILQSLKRDQPLQQQQQLQQPQPPQQQPKLQQQQPQPPQQPKLQQQHPQPPTDSNPFCDIPELYHISLEELNKVDKAAFNAGNFSCKLVNRLFPELFGPDHLRTRYSYHGQRKINKSELDPIRKGYIQRYVLYFHPDVKDPKFYQNIVVVKINEMLRRPVKPTNH